MTHDLYLYQGKEMTLAEAMRASGCTVNRGCVKDRLRKGWPLARALTLPNTKPARHKMSIRPLERDWGIE